MLRELWLKPGKGVVKDTGTSYRLDAARGRLTAPNGRVYPVTVDPASGVIEFQLAGTVRLSTQPRGFPVFIDGRSAGATPLSTTVRAGRHQVQVRTASGREVIFEVPVEVPPGGAWSLSMAVPGQASSRGR